MDFNAAINGIRTALYGFEVRECIASGMEWVKKFADDASGQAALAVSWAIAAKKSADAAKTSETNAKASATASKTSETNAKASETASKTSETNAATSASVAKEYLEQVKTITTGAQGWYATPAALQSAVPIGENGWFAFVGTTDTIWTWDSDTSAWVDTGATSQLAEYPTKKEVNENLERKLDLSGGVMTGQISGSLSGSAAKDRENTMVFSSNAPKNAEESVCVVGAKTKDGAWVFGAESEKSDAVLSFSSDENYKNGSSERKKVYIPVPDENTTLFGITESSYDSANDSGCVRFGDGTQICYGGIHNAASGTKYVFVLPFADDFEPKVITSRHYGSASGGSGGLIWVYNTTSTSFRAGSASNMYGMWIAIGRYK